MIFIGANVIFFFFFKGHMLLLGGGRQGMAGNIPESFYFRDLGLAHAKAHFGLAVPGTLEVPPTQVCVVNDFNLPQTAWR